MTCPSCSTWVQPGQTVCPSCGVLLPASMTQPPPSQVGILSTFLAALLGLIGLLHLLGALTGLEGLGVLKLVVTLVLIPLFIWWFFLVRRNAGHWGPQRRSSGWAIGAWFLPPVFLWFPFQIADDAWRASRPPDSSLAWSRALVVGWWLSWLLAWFTGFSRRDTVVVGPGGTFTNTSIEFSLGSNVVSGVSTGAAGLLGAAMVVIIGRWQQRRIRETAMTAW